MAAVFQEDMAAAAQAAVGAAQAAVEAARAAEVQADSNILITSGSGFNRVPLILKESYCELI